MDSDECRVRIKAWLVEGLHIEEHDKKGRKKHLRVNPRDLVLPDELEMNQMVECPDYDPLDSELGTDYDKSEAPSENASDVVGLFRSSSEDS